MDELREPTINRRFGLSLLVAAAGMGLCFTIAGHHPEFFWRAALLGIIPVWLVTMGATGLIAIGNLTGGRWATAARPFYLASMKTLPLVALLFLPLAFGLEHIYPWARSGTAAVEGMSANKVIWLSPTFVLVRSAGYFVVWFVVAAWLDSVSRLDLPPGSTFAMRRAGAASLVVLVPTVTFAAFDWVMSLEPLWYSSIFGAILSAAGVVAAHSLAIYGLARSPNLLPWIFRTETGEAQDDYHAMEIFADLGNLLLAFTMVVTYFSFSQFLIIWSGNLPSEISWYLTRLSGNWRFAAIAVVLIGFALPFLVLLSRDAKRDLRTLTVVVMISLTGVAVYMYWIIVPATFPTDATGNAASIGALLAISGLWSAANSWQLGRVLYTSRDGINGRI